MISIYIQQVAVLIKRLLICYLAYFISRLIFYFANTGYFQSTTIFDVLLDCLVGLRVDSFSIVVSNCLFIVLSLLPLNIFWNRIYQGILKCLFILCNAVFLAFNCIDVAYFPFIRKRSSADLLKQMGGQSDLGILIPQFLKDFWWAFICFIILIIGMSILYNRIKLPVKNRYSFSQPKQWLIIIFIFVLSAGFAVLAVRGGLQRVPITLVDAGSATSSEEVPILLNTPFTIIKSMENKAIEEYNFYSPEQLKAIYDPVRHYKDSIFKKQNVVILILESFAKEYTRLGRKSVTPFLDSLMDHSLVFTNAYSNGSKSIEGIPAILSSLPSLMENPFINSLYSLNDQTSLASILNAEGYNSSFFHGGINGTMNFDAWAALAGYNQYYGMNEYNNKNDFDNFWGIWDEPFLQYSVQKMTGFKEPFHTAIFTLSSHHPYKVPEKYKNKFPKGDLVNAECVGYSDYALKEFFISAKKTSWFKNTLFVLTADHGSLSNHPFYTNVVGNQSIPVLFFKPDNSLKAINKAVFSQTDILPSVLNLLGYNKPFFSFGESYTDKNRGHDYFYADGTHFLYGDSLLFSFKNSQLTRAYQYNRDSTLSQDILNKYPSLDSTALVKFKAFIQTYNQTLLKNKGRLK